MAWRNGDGAESLASPWNNPLGADCSLLTPSNYSAEILMVSTNDRQVINQLPKKDPVFHYDEVKRKTYVLSRFGEDKDGVCRVAVMAPNENRARYVAATRLNPNYPVQAWLDKTQSDCIEYSLVFNAEAIILSSKDRTRMSKG
jgi:hypothetical protein